MRKWWSFFLVKKYKNYNSLTVKLFSSITAHLFASDFNIAEPFIHPQSLFESSPALIKTVCDLFKTLGFLKRNLYIYCDNSPDSL